MPKWINDTSNLTLLVFVLAFGLVAISKNTPGKLKILADRIEIKSKQSVALLKYSDLKRISFVNKSFWMNPYRIQFLFKNSESVKVRIKSELALKEVFELLKATVPNGLELYHAEFEEIEM